MDAGRRASSDLLHVLAGLPERDVDELSGLIVGEQVEAPKPRPLAGGGELLLGKTDDGVEPFCSCLGGDHAREHPVSFEVV
jgi:hypothetical protein